jgi:TP901 family phage tail tape measure protein
MAEQKLRYVITGDATGLNGALNRASTRLKTFGQGIKNVGASLQRVAIPLAIAGGAAVKMGVDFDKSMTKIKSLVGLAGDDVDAMSGKVREMARETGVSSSKAANALFFITSAGLEGEQAMAVLNASLKASAVGLGDVATVADLSTSAMNAYSESGLTASQATDVLTAAVREGKLNSEELAGSMGQVLPIASQMGVSFNDVGAAMAAMSRTGTTASIGATQLRAVLSGLLKPTVQAEKALASMGLSSGGLKQQIQDEGLLSVLSTLKERFDQNSDAAAQVFPNIRALSGVLNLTGDNADKAREIFEKLNKTNNDTQVAFDKTSQSASFRLTKALNTARESFAQMGAVLLETLLPLFQKITGAITNLFDRFNNLDSATQKIVAGVGVLVIALPTLLSLFGTLTTIVGALLTPVGLIAAALAGIAFIIHKNWNEILPVLVGVYNQFVDLYNSSLGLRLAIHGVGFAFKVVFKTIKLQIDQVVNVFKTFWNLILEAGKGFDADFGSVLENGFNNAKDITGKYATDIKDEFIDGFSNALDSRLEKTTVDAVQGTLTSVGDKFKGFFTGLTTGFGGGGGQRQRQESVLTGTNIGQKDNTGLLLTPVGQENTEKATEKVSVFKNLLDAVGNSAAVVGEGIKGAFHGAFQSMMQGENVFKALGKMLLDLIKKLIAAALAAFVLSTLIGGLGLGGSGGAFEGMDKFGSLFTQFSGVKMAKGGIVSTPTMGLMGEYPGARSNPEVIAPLDRLKSMIGDTGSSKVQVGGQFTLRGQDLVVALQRANRNRDRIN